MMLVASLPLLRLLGMIAALTKDKNAAVALNNVNNGGVNELIKKVLFNFALIRTLYRAHDKRRLLSRYGAQPQRLHALLPRPKGRERCINKVQWGDGYSSSPSVLSDLAC